MIDAVAVIESLPPGETRTGENLVNHIRSERKEAWYYFADSAAKFIEAVQDVDRVSRSFNKKVALHFEAHGSDQGFELANGDFIPWHRLKRDIQNINFTQRNHLLVTMAVCEGLWLLEIISATDSSPFHSLIACQEVVYVSGIERGFKGFYSELLRGRDVATALAELNQVQSINPEFRLVTSEQMFAEAYGKYLRDLNTPEMIQVRFDTVFNELVRRKVFSPEQKQIVFDLYFKEVKGKEEESFVDFRAKFFMHDAFPENMAEFCPTYEELIAKGSAN